MYILFENSFICTLIIYQYCLPPQTSYFTKKIELLLKNNFYKKYPRFFVLDQDKYK